MYCEVHAYYTDQDIRCCGSADTRNSHQTEEEVQREKNKVNMMARLWWVVGLLAWRVRGEPVCNTEQLGCENGRCVPQSWACDGEDDCGDGTDERDCAPGDIVSCSADEFLCGSGLCIPLAWQCDGEKDCPEAEGLDEWALLCGNNGS